MNKSGSPCGGLASRRNRHALLAFLAPVLALSSHSALASWSLTPQISAGLTWESNPRYVSDDYQQDVSGTFGQVGLDGSYKAPADQVTLSTSFQQSNYLDSNGRSNQDLNSDNWYTNLSAAHEAARGNIGLTAGYAESPIRSGDVDPNAPPQADEGGRYSNGTQKNSNLGSQLNYNLSPRNRVALNYNTGEVTYDVSGNRPLNDGYFDYTNNSAAISISHFVNEKNFFQIALNGGTFTSTAQNGPAKNTTDSYGINAAYSYTVTETVTATATAGVSRSSVDIRGLPVDPVTGVFCPLNALCVASDEARNFVGNFSINKRSESTTLDFSASRSLAPRSNGAQVVQDQFSLYWLRTLTARLSATAGALYSNSSAVADLGRQNQDYYNFNASLTWKLTPTLSTYGKYSYVSSDDGGATSRDTNNILFFGVAYRGVGMRW